MPRDWNPKRSKLIERLRMPINLSPKGLETNKHGPKKICTGNEKGRQEKPGNKKRLEVPLEKPQEKNPKKIKQGEATPSHGNLESKEVDETNDFEVSKLLLKQKVPLNKILDPCPKFKAKVISKEMRGLNVELKATTNGIACNMAHHVDLPKM